MFNLLSDLSDRANFDEMIEKAARGMLETLTFLDESDDCGWMQDPEDYAEIAFASSFDLYEKVDDVEEAHARYIEVFPQAVRDWQKEMMIDHLTEAMCGDEGAGHKGVLIVIPGGTKDGLSYNPVTIDYVGLDADGDNVAYRQTTDAQDGDWQLGSIEDAVEEALSLREQLKSIQKEVEEQQL